MVGPSPRVTVALVSMLVGGLPAAVSCAARYIEKQPAWAAPTSSSGFVPPLVSPSNRVLKVKGAFRNPLAPLIEPEPSFNVPFHCALAFEMAISDSFFVDRGTLLGPRASGLGTAEPPSPDGMRAA